MTPTTDTWEPTTVELTIPEMIDKIGELAPLVKLHKELSDKLKKAMGGATAYGEAFFASLAIEQYSSLDTKGLRDAHPDIADQFTSIETKRVLRVRAR